MSWVLIIEDHDDTRELACELLEFHGIRAESASNAASALRKLEGRPPPCAIILDVVLPDADAEELIRTARATVQARVPVLAMSASEKTPASADAFLRKPFEWSRFVAAVEELCEPKRGNG